MSAQIEQDYYARKTDFSEIYNQPDPRPYYRTLGALDYEIPAHGAAVFECLLEEMGGREGRTVLDVCCSYGINAALLNHDLELDDLNEHYRSVEETLDEEQLAEVDRCWFAKHSRPDPVSMIGLDVAASAVRYAESVGLLDHGLTVDLETDPCDSEARQTIAAADLVTVTGGIGYIGEKTFAAIVEASGDEPPWIAALSLRWIEFEPIAETLDALGLVTEHLDGYCVPQRRFADEAERQAALSALRERGLDAAEELRTDAHCAELFLARPPEAVRDAPIDAVLSHLTTV